MSNIKSRAVYGAKKALRQAGQGKNTLAAETFNRGVKRSIEAFEKGDASAALDLWIAYSIIENRGVIDGEEIAKNKAYFGKIIAEYKGKHKFLMI